MCLPYAVIKVNAYSQTSCVVSFPLYDRMGVVNVCFMFHVNDFSPGLYFTMFLPSLGINGSQ